MFFVVPDRTTALISHCIKYIVIVIVNLFHGASPMDLHIGPWLYQCPQKLYGLLGTGGGKNGMGNVSSGPPPCSHSPGVHLLVTETPSAPIESSLEGEPVWPSGEALGW